MGILLLYLMEMEIIFKIIPKIILLREIKKKCIKKELKKKEL